MGNGIAIVTTNHAGIPDVVDNKANGLMVDKNSIDVNSIYNYLEELLADRTKLSTIAVNNYTKVEDNYTEVKYINNMGYIFNKLILKK
jgi:glycosyltransferase involved in cell wall biosynthesis